MSKKYIEFEGFCPESKLKGEQLEMRLNEYDFWESEKTGLQIAISEPFAVILKWRGKGELRASSPKESDLHYGLFLTESMDIKGEEILLYKEGLFEYEFDLEEYIDAIYDTEEEYQKEIFNPNDPIFKKQKKHLEKIAKEKYIQLLDQYNKAKDDWYKGEKFSEFHKMLYNLKIVFSFNWMRWTAGKRVLINDNIDYSKCSLLDLSMFITTIFRSDRFDDVSIKEFEGNGVLGKIFQRMDRIINGLMIILFIYMIY